MFLKYMEVYQKCIMFSLQFSDADDHWVLLDLEIWGTKYTKKTVSKSKVTFYSTAKYEPAHHVKL